MASDSSINAEVKETATCTWTIDGFSNVNGRVYYPNNIYAPNSIDQFYLHLIPNNLLFDINHVYICLQYNQNQTELSLQYRVSILDANGYKKYTREYTWNYSQFNYSDSYLNVASYISRDKCNELLVNGSLKIYCEVDVLKSKPQLSINQHVKETATLTWSIDGYNNFNDKMGSSKFSCNKEQFDLLLIRENPLWLRHDYICLHYTGNQTELPLQYRVSILDANGHKQYTKEYTWNYSKSDYVNCDYNVTNYIHRDKCKQLAVNGSLEIYCEVDVLESISSSINTKIETQDIAKDYLSIFEDGEFSDFVFVVKSILSARSKVFKTMFKTDFEEKRLNRVEVTDIDIEVFEELLRYIYTGAIPDLDKYDSELFMAADNYQLDHFKSICQQSLGSSLNAESVAAVLQFADLHQADQLRSKCIDYITTNAAAVVATDGWKQLRKNRLDLVAEMFEKMAIGDKNNT